MSAEKPRDPAPYVEAARELAELEHPLGTPVKSRRPPDDPGDGPRPIGSPPPFDELHEAEVAIVEVPGLLRCPVCRSELELVQARTSTARPILTLHETAPDPRTEGG